MRTITIKNTIKIVAINGIKLNLTSSNNINYFAIQGA